MTDTHVQPGSSPANTPSRRNLLKIAAALPLGALATTASLSRLTPSASIDAGWTKTIETFRAAQAEYRSRGSIRDTAEGEYFRRTKNGDDAYRARVKQELNVDALEKEASIAHDRLHETLDALAVFPVATIQQFTKKLEILNEDEWLVELSDEMAAAILRDARNLAATAEARS